MRACLLNMPLKITTVLAGYSECKCHLGPQEQLRALPPQDLMWYESSRLHCASALHPRPTPYRPQSRLNNIYDSSFSCVCRSQSKDSYDIEFPGYWLDGVGGVMPRAPATLLTAVRVLPPDPPQCFTHAQNEITARDLLIPSTRIIG